MADGIIVIDTELKTEKLKNKLSKINIDIEKQKTKVHDLQLEYDRLNDALTDARARGAWINPDDVQNTERARLNLEEAQIALERMELNAQQTEAQMQEIESSTEDTGANLDAAKTAIDKFTKKLVTMAKKVFVFTLISKALRSIRTYMQSVLSTNEAYNKSVAQLKGTMLTAFQPIISFVVPILTAFINVLTRAFNVLAKFNAMLFGTSVTASSAAAKSLYDQANAAGAVGDAAKEAKRQMSGLDEMNTWQSEQSGGASGGGGISPDFTNNIKGQISALEVYVSGALLALGAILTFTGVSIPIGIALMAAGAIGLVAAAKENWSKMPDGVKKTLSIIATIASGALLALGIILTCTGNLPVGIALILAGAAGLATAQTINWDALLDKIRNTWDRIRSWFKTNVQPKFTKKFWADKFDNIKTALTDKIKGAINGAITLFNRFADWINQKMNIKWSAVKIAGTTVIPQGNIQLMRLNKIPMLAQGAVIPANHEFMAILGDQKQGTNIETPEALLRKIFREEAAAGNFTFVAQLDGRTIFKEVIDQAKAKQRMTGINPFKLGGAL